MKIRLDITKKQWVEICAAASVCFTDSGFIKCLTSLKEPYTVLRVGKLADMIIQQAQPEQAATFITYLQSKDYLQISIDTIHQIKYDSLPKAKSYQLAQAIFTREKGIAYFNYWSYCILLEHQSELAESNQNIIRARLALLHKDDKETGIAIAVLKEQSYHALCFKVIHAYNINRLQLELEKQTSAPDEPRSYTDAFDTILKEALFVAHPQLISSAYQLEQQDDYHYLRWGGVVAWERSWLAIIFLGFIAAASLPCLAALLVVSHGLAVPALLALGQFLLTLLPLHSLLLISTILSGSAVFGLLAELVAPAFNQLFFRNLYYFPVSLANHWAKQGNHFITKCAYGTFGFITGLFYHPLFMLFFLISNTINTCWLKLVAGLNVILHPLISLKNTDYRLSDIFTWPKQLWQSYQIEKFWQNLLDNVSPELLEKMQTNAAAVSPALKNMSQQGQNSQEQLSSNLTLVTQGSNSAVPFFDGQANNAIDRSQQQAPVAHNT